jgi:hypothetical protein
VKVKGVGPYDGHPSLDALHAAFTSYTSERECTAQVVSDDHGYIGVLTGGKARLCASYLPTIDVDKDKISLFDYACILTRTPL